MIFEIVLPLLNFCICFRGDVCVRVKVLVFLLELFVYFSTNHEGAHLNSELQEFLHQFLSTLISEVCIGTC